MSVSEERTAEHRLPLRSVEFRFYEELNDFLPLSRRKRSCRYEFTGTPAVKDAIEALGVPHTEVDLILIDGRSVDFAARLSGGERVAVYPQFERFDISALARLRPVPLREPRFVLDVHLGRLARLLRLLGFDARYRNDYADATLVDLAEREQRIVLTRDRGLLKRSRVSRGHWLRSTEPQAQAREVLQAFDLTARARPFSRCTRCNGLLEPVAREQILDRLPERVAARHGRFRRCRDCGRLYWPGTHYPRLRRLISSMLAG